MYLLVDISNPGDPDKVVRYSRNQMPNNRHTFVDK